MLIILGILGIIWITKFKIDQINHKKYEQSVEHNYLPVKNLPYCTWNLSKNSIQTKNLEKDPDRLWGREILLDIVDKSGFIYVLVYGTILGSLRHQGFIDHDGDADVKILAGKYPANNGGNPENLMVKLSNEQKRYLIATKLNKIAKTLYPQYIIDVHIGCYSSTPSKIVGIDDIKKYDNALASLLKVVELDPTYENVYNLIALIYKNSLKDYTKAIEYYNKELELTPDAAHVYRNIA